MDALNRLVGALGSVADMARGAACAAASLAVVGLLWDPALGVAKSLVAAGGAVMAGPSGLGLLAALGVLWLCSQKSA